MGKQTLEIVRGGAFLGPSTCTLVKSESKIQERKDSKGKKKMFSRLHCL